VITMNDNRIATVGDLIAALTDHDPATPVRIATESAEFMDHTIGRVWRCGPRPPPEPRCGSSGTHPPPTSRGRTPPR
jgi:hypothetical protein